MTTYYKRCDEQHGSGMARVPNHYGKCGTCGGWKTSPGMVPVAADAVLIEDREQAACAAGGAIGDWLEQIVQVRLTGREMRKLGESALAAAGGRET